MFVQKFTFLKMTSKLTSDITIKPHPKPKKVVELKETLQSIWDSLLRKAVKEFRKRWRLVLQLGWKHWMFSVTATLYHSHWLRLWIWICNVFGCRLNNVILRCVHWYIKTNKSFLADTNGPRDALRHTRSSSCYAQSSTLSVIDRRQSSVDRWQHLQTIDMLWRNNS